MQNRNYFASPAAAARYAAGRPFFHPLAIKKIREVCCQSGRIDRALDVGCGTGQSTLALQEVADEIVGMDSSAEMLSRAAVHPQIRHIEGQAERIPFADRSLGLITVAGAFHWFDQRQFMHEAKRVLRPGGWLVIYNDRFTGRMNRNDDYAKWNREHYLVRYPTPPRNNPFPTCKDASANGFGATRTEHFMHEIQFSLEQLVSYLTTQTNVIAAVMEGMDDYSSAGRWLLNSIRPLFSGATESFIFSCQLEFLKKIN